MVGVNRANVFAVALLLCACKKAPEAASSGASDTKDDGARVVVRASAAMLASADVPALAADAAKKAKARGLRPFVELRADWCEPCKKLEATEDDPRMKDAFAGTYLLRVDVEEAGTKLGPYRASAIPVFFEVGDDGRPTGRKLDGGAWREDTPAGMAPALKAFFHPAGSGAGGR